MALCIDCLTKCLTDLSVRDGREWGYREQKCVMTGRSVRFSKGTVVGDCCAPIDPEQARCVRGRTCGVRGGRDAMGDALCGAGRGPAGGIASPVHPSVDRAKCVR
jgi:hypothetical protein